MWYCERFLNNDEIYFDKDLIFLRNAYDELKESLLDLKKFTFNVDVKLNQEDIISLDNKTWTKKLNIDKYITAADITRAAHSSLPEEIPYGLSTIVKDKAKKNKPYPVGMPFSEEKDVPNWIKNCFFYYFGFIEDVLNKRDYSPVNILMSAYRLKTQGLIDVDLDEWLTAYFDEIEFLFQETEPIFYNSRIWYERKGFLYTYFDQKLWGMLGTHCAVSTEHIFTIFRLRFIVIFIYTYHLKQEGLI